MDEESFLLMLPYSIKWMSQNSTGIAVLAPKSELIGELEGYKMKKFLFHLRFKFLVSVHIDTSKHLFYSHWRCIVRIPPL